MFPDTRASLLMRVRDPADQAAWVEFTQLYAPVIFRAARARGLQPADAEDVVQKVLVAVSTALEKRPHDPNRAQFRTWLSTVTKNATLNALSRRPPDAAVGGTSVQMVLTNQVEPDLDSQTFDEEVEREMFRVAAARVSEEFEADTWQAFWQSAVDGLSPDEVAKKLGKRVGSVYAARSRVMRRLRLEIERMKS